MCGVGTASNCVYGPDGKGTPSHTNEDAHLGFRYNTLGMQKLFLRTEITPITTIMHGVTHEVLQYFI